MKELEKERWKIGVEKVGSELQIVCVRKKKRKKQLMRQWHDQ